MTRTSTPAPQKVKVTERAVMRRLNRKLAKDSQLIRQWRNPQPGAARFYIVDTDTNCVTAETDDLKDWANEEGVLKPWEEIGD